MVPFTHPLRTLFCVCVLIHPHSELVWLGHEYTSNLVDTAAACVNAGTCLEDGNLYTILNAFDHIGEAVEQVSVPGLSLGPQG